MKIKTFLFIFSITALGITYTYYQLSQKIITSIATPPIQGSTQGIQTIVVEHPDKVSLSENITPAEKPPEEQVQVPSQTNSNPRPTTTAKPAPSNEPFSAETLESKLISLTNQARVSNGLSAYKVDTAVMQAARTRSTNMAGGAPFSHGTNLSYAKNALSNLGLVFNSNINFMAENISYNQTSVSTSATDAFNAFMNSTGHRANILSTQSSSFGVGVALGKDGRTKYYTMIFTNP